MLGAAQVIHKLMDIQYDGFVEQEKAANAVVLGESLHVE
jgi:hypothetical protein